MPEGPPRLRHGDKVLHVVAYFGLAALGGWRIIATRPAGFSRILWQWAALYMIYGVLDEVLQPLVGRSMTLGDWLADVLGIVAATWLVSRLGRRRLSDVNAANAKLL
jgi:VanZ family protein